MSRADKPISVVRGADNIPWNQRDREHLVANYEHGMTLLEHYAGLAMQGQLSAYEGDFVKMNSSALARNCVECARALIAQLEKEAK